MVMRVSAAHLPLFEAALARNRTSNDDRSLSCPPSLPGGGCEWEQTAPRDLGAASTGGRCRNR
eukprot:8568828-Alexandrium_andersonii.AAC.1